MKISIVFTSSVLMEFDNVKRIDFSDGLFRIVDISNCVYHYDFCDIYDFVILAG